MQRAATFLGTSIVKKVVLAATGIVLYGLSSGTWSAISDHPARGHQRLCGFLALCGQNI
jgi:hypothetical protein